MVSMRSDVRVPVSKYVCTRVRGAIPHMRACSVHRPMHDACTRSRERYGKEEDGETRRRVMENDEEKKEREEEEEEDWCGGRTRAARA